MYTHAKTVLMLSQLKALNLRKFLRLIPVILLLIFQINNQPIASASVLEGYDVLVLGARRNDPHALSAQTRIANLGATVDTLGLPQYLTPEMLARYDVVWIASGAAGEIHAAGKSDIVQEYVYNCNGGGLIVEQPNIEEVGVVNRVNVLPYYFEIRDGGYGLGSCVPEVIEPAHPLVEDLDPGLLPPCLDRVGEIGDEWETLVIDGEGAPCIVVAAYGSGKMVVELGGTTLGCPLICDEDRCMKDIMIERMIKWVAKKDCKIVPVDIKPGSCPNSLNPKAKAVLTIAVLGTNDFAVENIAPEIFCLTREGLEGVYVTPVRWSYRDLATPIEGDTCDCHSSHKDGYIDLLLKFDVPELVGRLKLNEVAGQTIPLTLFGELIKGKDCIRVLE